MKIIHGKSVLLGSQGVGKTSLINKFVHKQIDEPDAYNSPGNSTIGACFFTCNVNLPEARVTFQVWDTAGQERFRSMAPMYYRDATTAILVFDITSHNSFLAMQSWVQELKRNVEETMVLVVVGNKVDLAHERQVDPEECHRYAESIGASYYEISALNNEGVDRVFFGVAVGLFKLASGDKDIVTSIRVYDSEKSGVNHSIVPLHEEALTNGSIAHGVLEKRCC